MILQKMEKQRETRQDGNIQMLQNEIPIDSRTSLQTSLSGFWEEISRCSSRILGYRNCALKAI